MRYSQKFHCLLLLLLLAQMSSQAQSDMLKNIWTQPSNEAKPWVFWYWLHGAVSPEGITADIKAMKEAGIGGAYLMPIKDTARPSIYQPAARQLTPQWWKMVKHAMNEAKSYNIKLAIHVSDGFALAGGPWIKPENSMKKIVWTQTNISGGQTFNDTLATPEVREDYYRDIALFAFPALTGSGSSTQRLKPQVSTSNGADASFLTDPANTKNFTSDDSCWIQYNFDQPFTLRTITIRAKTNYQSNRLIVEWSNDGQTFFKHIQLQSPRHGWQDWDSDYTHSVPAVTAKYFRFVYTKVGSEPGAEDLDAAKWRPVLKVMGIELNSEPRLHQYEGKNGEVWRVSDRTNSVQIPGDLFVPQDRIIDITKYLDKSGRLVWKVPAGNWTVIRIGNTSTGHKNETAGGGKGLECDKFDPAAVTSQFNHWFGEIIKQGGATARDVVKFLHVDSWECGSQNWSPTFREEFKNRRGYDPYKYLPIMAGIPVESIDVSEGFLYDVRKTIAELINDKFFGTLQNLAAKNNVKLVAESVAPTMLSDGMEHYSRVDIPMGEFWLRSPTHDKPNDMLDAISGGHVYGKNIIQAEAFTQIRAAFDEHPGNIKFLADRNFALGINRLVFHVFMHNPWLNKKPGVTLDAIGLLFQRDQTWWPRAKAWTDYIARCQALLQVGSPVADIAVFTGEEYPRRSLLPERLVPMVPSLFGKDAVEWETKRLLNTGQPTRKPENGVTYVANTTDAASWTDPLRGYAYDSYNPDALLRLTSVKSKAISLSTGATYKLLVIPNAHKLLPDSGRISSTVMSKLVSLARDGATILMLNSASGTFGLQDDASKLRKMLAASGINSRDRAGSYAVGKGRIITDAWQDESLEPLGITPDVVAMGENGERADSVVWAHRKGAGLDIYFISNQKDIARTIDLSFRVSGKIPELWNAVDGSIRDAQAWNLAGHRTALPLSLDKYGSVFVVFRRTATNKSSSGKNSLHTTVIGTISPPWRVQFDSTLGGPSATLSWQQLTDWKANADSAVRYYSGPAVYENTFSYQASGSQPVWLNLYDVRNMATIWINGKACGTVWTQPYRLNITQALRTGVNSIRVEVINTWANRMIGDGRLPVERRITNTVYPFKMDSKPLLAAGLLGPVTLEVEDK